MSLIDWKKTEVVGGEIYSSSVIEDYEIHARNGGFYVVRLVDECQDIGPLGDFDSAEDVIAQMAQMLTLFEENAWRILAANALRKAGLLTIQSVVGEEETS